MLSTIFYPFLGFCLILLILYLFKPNPEFPLMAWIGSSSFAMLSLMLFTTGLTYPLGYTSNSTEWINASTNITYTNVNQEPTLYDMPTIVKNSLALMFMILTVYLALIPFVIKKKKRSGEFEEAM